MLPSSPGEHWSSSEQDVSLVWYLLLYDVTPDVHDFAPHLATSSLSMLPSSRLALKFHLAQIYVMLLLKWSENAVETGDGVILRRCRWHVGRWIRRLLAVERDTVAA